MTERSLFLALLEIDEPAKRSAFLEQACAGEPGLRSQVEHLLNAHEELGDFMNRPAALIPAGVEENAMREGPGTRIGHYELLEQIGEGGFGVVFMALQERPIRRMVAVKVLKPGMDTRQVVARFEAERQALALMAHPHIAQVLDGGETDSGRPYFVMEFIRGIPITDFCDQNHLSFAERLEMFSSVCKAVQHAHQKGIIHRDLKPSNILVTLDDTLPVVKVIDFGIAKATGSACGGLTEKTLFTNFAHLVGTPIYMSPEQAQLSRLDIDTRTDIYSLGVLLYELLTGTTPFERERLRTLSSDEIGRIIREEEPPRPSTRLHALGQAAAIASSRPTGERARLSQLCRGELDWIVMKALEKDRDRRYDTVAALAADVERYLHDEPVQACPPSRWYRFRKLARRHKREFITLATLMVGVLLASVALVVSNVWIRQEQARAAEARDRADRAQKLAEGRADEIRQGLERLQSATTLVDRGRWYAGKNRLDDANAAFRKAAELRPDHATAWVELSELYCRLGLWELAAADQARELELREPESTSRWYRHALLRLHEGDQAGYAAAVRRMWARFRGTTDWVFLADLVRASILSPAIDADLLEPTLDLAGHLRRSQENSWFYLYISGMAHYRAGRFGQAVDQLRQSLDGTPEWPLRSLSYPILAMALERQGQPVEARQALADAAAALDRWTEEMYQVEQDEWHWVHDLGGAFRWPIAWWDWLEFQHFYDEAKLLLDGVPSPDDARLRVLRGRALAALRWHGRADDEYTRAAQLRPHDSRLRFEAHRNRGYKRVDEGQWHDAAAEFRQAAELRPDQVHLWYYRAVSHAAAGDLDNYRETCGSMFKRFEATADGRVICFVLAACVLREDALSGGSTNGPAPAHQARLDALARLAPAQNDFGISAHGAALYRAGKFVEAVESFESAARIYRPRARDWCFLAMAHQRLGHNAEARRCLSEAVRWIGNANREKLDDPTGTRPAWGDWPERAEHPLLLSEAETLLKEAAGTPQTSVN
jgi:serine/threonine protein kinase/Flp pilus assembly protein TadD